jgi:hypothetical protein
VTAPRHRLETPTAVPQLALLRAASATAVADPAHLATPFEDWCHAMGIHPEALGAWERFSAEMVPAG